MTEEERFQKLCHNLQQLTPQDKKIDKQKIREQALNFMNNTQEFEMQRITTNSENLVSVKLRGSESIGVFMETFFRGYVVVYVYPYRDGRIKILLEPKGE